MSYHTTHSFKFQTKNKKKSRQRGSNPRSTAYEAVALPLGHTGCSVDARLPKSNKKNNKKITKEYSGRGLNSRPSACKADVITTRLPEHTCFTAQQKNKNTHGGTRTRNPQIRSLMLYPLSHTGYVHTQLIVKQTKKITKKGLIKKVIRSRFVRVILAQGPC